MPLTISLKSGTDTRSSATPRRLILSGCLITTCFTREASRTRPDRQLKLVQLLRGVLQDIRRLLRVGSCIYTLWTPRLANLYGLRVGFTTGPPGAQRKT